MLVLLISVLNLFFFMFSILFFNSQILVVWQLLQLSSFTVEIMLLLDFLSILMAVTVSIIAISVFIFSFSYMSQEKFFLRFHLILSFFVLSMFFLTFSPNLVSILLGWDGLGITSYLLVIYYNSNKSFNAGMITVMTNRLGDIFLITAIGLVMGEGSWLIHWYTSYFVYNPSVMFLLSMASFTKSAQMPFSAWLPAAMAAPTPVSALVHSSTLVTAGVYLMIRHLTLTSPTKIYLLILVSGMLTMTMASLSALNEKDMKKMIALSTLSQLGVMMVSVGVGCPLMAFLHLIIHAFFKAMMFVATGSYIHMSSGYQNLLKTGSHLLSSPISASSALVASLSLAAVPFSAAFFSKEPILELVLWKSNNLFMFVLFLLGVALTVAYSIRFIYLVILSFNKGEVSFMASEDDNLVNSSLLVLFIPAFSMGMFFSNFTFNNTFSFTLYSTNLKHFILFVLFMSVILMYTFQTLKTRFFQFLQFSFFFMWSLPLFSSKFWSLKSMNISDFFMWNNTWLVKSKQPVMLTTFPQLSLVFYESSSLLTNIIIAPVFFFFLILFLFLMWS
uniref:NADH-ubiquinone oxidoreductase chain 5 n=1 Tax=Paracyclopina nana TaxID=565004 RepID=C0J6R9_PARNA|nr:NADH dehydrogenase subunit 5 [Paracyclopina nana]